MLKENQNLCEDRGHQRTYVIKSSAPTSNTFKKEEVCTGSRTLFKSQQLRSINKTASKLFTYFLYVHTTADVVLAQSFVDNPTFYQSHSITL